MFAATRFMAERFQHPENLRRLVASYGFEAPNTAAVEKWGKRGSIPASWLVIMLGVLEMEHGTPISVLPYLQR